MATNSNFRNKMSARALTQQEGASLDFVKNPKNNKIFFSCGNTVGYISKKVDINKVELDDLDYAEVKSEKGDWIPCLFMKASNNVVRSLK